MKRLVSVACGVIALAGAALAGPTIVWDKTWDSGFNDCCGGVALDTVNGAVYTTGISRDGDMATDDIVTLKYDTDGNFQWAKVFDSDTTDDAFDVAVDGSGFIYVAGSSRSALGDRIRLIKYDADSAEIWNTLHVSSRTEYAYAIATDATGNIYVTGPSWSQYRTVKFASDGNEVWANVVEGFSGNPNDLAVSPNGSIYVAGYASEATPDPCVVRYNSDGDTIWHKFYDLGAVEYFNGVAVDEDGYLYLAGVTKADQDSAANILVAKLDADGNLLWNKTYDCGQDDLGQCIAADKGLIYVAGRSYNETSYVVSLPLLCYDKEGNLLWDTLLVSGADGHGIASDGKGNLYISTSQGEDFGLIKVHHTTAVEEPTSKESRASLEVLNAIGSNVILRYSLGFAPQGFLSFYSADGRLVESFPVSSNQSSFTWDASQLPSGVYFVRLEAGQATLARKAVLVR